MFASGSPFPKYEQDGVVFEPGQVLTFNTICLSNFLMVWSLLSPVTENAVPQYFRIFPYYLNKPFPLFQGNNAYIFPAVALGVMCCGSVSIPDELFLQAAEVITSQSSDECFFVRRELHGRGSCR